EGELEGGPARCDSDDGQGAARDVARRRALAEPLRRPPTRKRMFHALWGDPGRPVDCLRARSRSERLATRQPESARPAALASPSPVRVHPRRSRKRWTLLSRGRGMRSPWRSLSTPHEVASRHRTRASVTVRRGPARSPSGGAWAAVDVEGARGGDAREAPPAGEATRAA